MDEGRLFELHLFGIITTLTEVWVLVDGAGDETRNRADFFRVGAENMGKGGCKSGGGLSGWEVKLANVVAAEESEKGFVESATVWFR